MMLFLWRLAGAGFIAAGIFATINDTIPTQESVKPAILDTIPDAPAPLVET